MSHLAWFGNTVFEIDGLVALSPQKTSWLWLCW